MEQPEFLTCNNPDCEHYQGSTGYLSVLQRLILIFLLKLTVISIGSYLFFMMLHHEQGKGYYQSLFETLGFFVVCVIAAIMLLVAIRHEFEKAEKKKK